MSFVETYRDLLYSSDFDPNHHTGPICEIARESIVPGVDLVFFAKVGVEGRRDPGSTAYRSAFHVGDVFKAYAEHEDCEHGKRSGEYLRECEAPGFVDEDGSTPGACYGKSLAAFRSRVMRWRAIVNEGSESDLHTATVRTLVDSDQVADALNRLLPMLKQVHAATESLRHRLERAEDRLYKQARAKSYPKTRLQRSHPEPPA